MTDHEAYDEGYNAYWDGVDITLMTRRRSR